MRFRDLTVFLWTGAFLLAAEMALELRAERRGFDGYLLSILSGRNDSENEGELAAFGPSEEFPFRSPIVAAESARAARIWWSSSSYGAGRSLPVPKVFPNLTATILSAELGFSVQSLNSSAPGRTIVDNTKDLDRLGAKWQPSVAVLYQLTNDLHELAALPEDFNGADSAESGEVANTRTWSDPVRNMLERTTLYAQVSANITPRILDLQMLPTSVTPIARSQFEQRIERWIATATEAGATPVLVTFAPRYLDPTDLAPRDRHAMLRWNRHVSPEGYLATVKEWNELLRRTAEARGIKLVDLEKLLADRPELYFDFVHFTAEGHEQVSRIFARELKLEVHSAR